MSGNEVCYTNSLILLVKNMLCSKLHRQKGFNGIPFSYKIQGLGVGGSVFGIEGCGFSVSSVVGEPRSMHCPGQGLGYGKESPETLEPGSFYHRVLSRPVVKCRLNGLVYGIAFWVSAVWGFSDGG